MLVPREATYLYNIRSENEYSDQDFQARDEHIRYPQVGGFCHLEQTLEEAFLSGLVSGGLQLFRSEFEREVLIVPEEWRHDDWSGQFADREDEVQNLHIAMCILLKQFDHPDGGNRVDVGDDAAGQNRVRNVDGVRGAQRVNDGHQSIDD